MDSISKNTENKNWYQHKAFINGYGKFPYVILKVGHAFYMQIPIHFNKNNDLINYPGTHINAVNKVDVENYNIEKNGPLHEKIIVHCQWMKNKIEQERNTRVRMCLVEGPEIAYYFEETGIEFSTSIPSGGNLITQDYQLLTMNTKHYL